MAQKTKEKGMAGSIDMTQGSPYRLIFLFSMPLLLGNVLQQLYNMVDSVVVGNAIGEKALAAVGTGFPIIFMINSLFMGIGIGATIMISQYFGARDFENLQNTITTIYTGLMVGAIPLAVVGILISRPLLILMKVPDDGTLDMATTYMIVIFAGVIGTLGYNVNAGILQGLGDSKTSLIFLATAAVINTILDIVFAVFLNMGVMGVALATIIAQAFSWVFGILYINKHYSFLRIRPFCFHFHKALFAQAIRLGVPSGIQQALFSIGTMVMQALVNSYGSAFMAGFNGANKIDMFAFMPIQSFTSAVTTYVGQNIGAGKMDRVAHGTKAGLILSVGTSLAVGLLLFPFSAFMMRMFSQNPEVIDAGVAYLHTVLPFYALLSVCFIYNSALRGAGEMIVPMISSIISLWLVRVPAAYLFAHFFGKNSIYFSYAVGWFVGILISYLYYRSGKWKNKSVVGR